MTQKTINLIEKKPVNQIEKGTILKKGGDMFIVAKISEAQFSGVVNEALFCPQYNNSHQRRSPFAPRNHAVRNPAEAKYVLISLSTGLKFYPEFLTLQELLIRISKTDFEIVEKIEIKELF
ncbi:hypothetical protein [Peribacillus asahii]|uniref:hypothetical protein n=1 Tax=Peribacillus asahii TaxID=228899 RepID=UPI00380893FD